MREDEFQRRLVLLGMIQVSGKAAGRRAKCEEVIDFGDHAAAVIQFLVDDVAEYATLFVEEVLLGALEFLGVTLIGRMAGR